MSVPLLITADEINCLIYAYLQDSAFQHSAFAIRMEGRLDQSPHFSKHIPRGELVELLSKALLYVEVEAHWKGDAMTTNCKTEFSLLEPHICSLDPKAKSVHPPPRPMTRDKEPEQNAKINGDTGTKRKAEAPSAADGHVEKRARRTPEDMDIDKKVVPNVEPADRVPTTEIAKAAPPQQPKINYANLGRKLVDLQAVRLLPGHKAEVFVSAWNPTQNSLLSTGSKDGIVNIWSLNGSGLPNSDVKPLKISYFSKPEQGDLTSLDWNFDGSLLAIGSYDSILRIVTTAGKLYFSHRQHEGPIFAAKFSKSGEWLVTASLDGTACVWHVKNKRLHKQYRSHTDCCLDIDWLDDNTFASCGADSIIHIMKVDESKPIRTLSGHTDEINQIKCNLSRTKLASCADDQTARIWNVSDLSGSRSPDAIPGLSESDRVILLEGHEHSVSSIAWCPRTTAGIDIIATAAFDCTVRLWDSMTGECLKVLADHTRPVYALTFSPDGRWLGTGSGDGWMNIYSVKTKVKKWGWFAGPDKPGVFEIAWQQTNGMNRIALALERHQVGVIDVSQVTALQDDS
ncbi:hypothetical protein PILCRDRAFT_813977 [Piloderma croceum F 1598]|uniref:LisH domain-containing protein n=1 Tax=Piloderma croceum (strain F 1598) TaxID=765440 RepID=A0A0C3GB82_PILCF|nr:hypothetical protein PILCRDRAFT_813977 [Piloderma croceum F 1598]